MAIKEAYEKSAEIRKRVAAGREEGDGYEKMSAVERWGKFREAYEKFMKAREWGNAFESLGMMWTIARQNPEELEWRDTYPYVLGYRKYVRDYLQSHSDEAEKLMVLLGRSYRLSARLIFDDFLIYTEWDRPLDRKFYLPRRGALLPIVRQLQRLADGDLEILCISAPPGIGKSGLAIFFITWLAGRNPDDGILVSSHSRSILQGMYDECINEMDGKGEYRFTDVFPQSQIARTNAENLKIDLKSAKRFSSLQFGAVGEKLAGKVRAIQLLYCDDLIENMEEALSPVRLENKWRAYYGDLRQRKQGGCRELHLATRWTVKDVIGRLEMMYGEYEKAAFIKLPALDENGESNFDYGGNIGFTKEFFNSQREIMDSKTFDALYQQEPVERGGLLYERDQLNYFYDVPEGEPDGVVAACDTARGGADYTALAVGKIFGDKHYITDVVFTPQLPDVADRLVANALYKTSCQQAQFESNGAGGREADTVEQLLSAKVLAEGGHKTTILKKYTTANKETKILLSGGWVKEHCYFRDPKTVEKGSDYARFMKNLLGYTVAKPPEHDDAADVMAQYSLFAESIHGSVVQIVKRIW